MPDAREKSTLSLRDLQVLRSNRTAEGRHAVAVRVSRLVVEERLSAAEMDIALTIVAHLVHDVEERVRAAVSTILRSSHLLPAALAMQLAADVESVALPVLQFSAVLDDDHLVLIISQGHTAKQIAIARRINLSPRLAGALIETGKHTVVHQLLTNHTANIDAAELARVVELFPDDGMIVELANSRQQSSHPGRHDLRLADGIIEVLAGNLARYLESEHGLPRSIADAAVKMGEDRVLCDLIARERRVDKVADLALKMAETGHLTPALLLRVLCFGHLHFFETGLAAVSGLGIDEVRDGLYAGDAAAFNQLYQLARLPAHLREAFRIACQVAARQLRRNRPMIQDRYTQEVITGIVHAYRTVAPGDTDSVLSDLARAASQTSEERAYAEI